MFLLKLQAHEEDRITNSKLYTYCWVAGKNTSQNRLSLFQILIETIKNITVKPVKNNKLVVLF